MNVPSPDHLNPPVPFNLTIFKGYKENVISRATGHFLTKTQLAEVFLHWLANTGCPEEFFYATLTRVSQSNYFAENGRIIQGENNTFTKSLL